jgi:hypothetical protein
VQVDVGAHFRILLTMAATHPMASGNFVLNESLDARTDQHHLLKRHVTLSSVKLARTQDSLDHYLPRLLP